MSTEDKLAMNLDLEDVLLKDTGIEIEAETEAVKPGTLLKQKREQLGLTQKQVAERLRLRVSIIQSIDENNFSVGQVATFTRGYLRSYAKAVGMKESEVLSAFDQSYPLAANEQPVHVFSEHSKRQKSDSRIMKLTWLIFLIIGGASILWWWQDQNANEAFLSINNQNASLTATAPDEYNGEDTTNQATIELSSENTNIQSTDAPTSVSNNESDQLATATNQVITAATTLANDAAESGQNAVQQTSQVLQNTTNDVVDSVQATANSAIDQLATTTSSITEGVTTNQNQLELTFSSDCWIEVKDASDNILSRGTNKEGETIKLTGERPFSFVLCGPERVSMKQGGQPVDLSVYTSGKVARFKLP